MAATPTNLLPGLDGGIMIATSPAGIEDLWVVQGRLPSGADELAVSERGVAAVDRSADRLMSTPRLFGAGWDAVLEVDPDDDADALVSLVAQDPDVIAVGRDELLEGDTEVEASGPGGVGPVDPVLTSEGLLGLTADCPAAGDDSVATSAGYSAQSRHRGDLGREIDPKSTQNSDDPRCSVTTRGIGVAFGPGVDRAAAMARLAEIGDGVIPTPMPSVINNLGQIGSTPWYLAGFLAVLGLAGIHTLTIGSSRRDRHLAVARVLGLLPRQAAASVRWQALTLTATGAIVGVILGVVAGRLVWRRVAEGSGALVDTVVPAWAWVAAAAAALALALLVAVVPAARRRPSVRPSC
ncbi:MAG: FtsX-like permease family protein [Acidimicrobiales bacterium]